MFLLDKIFLGGKFWGTDRKKNYGTWVLRVQKQAVDVSTVRNLPRLDSDGVVALMMAQHADT